MDPGEIVEHKELNYLIIQACNYYELADKDKWISPLLVALRENQEVPTTTSGKRIAAAKEGEVSNYYAIETMMGFGTKQSLITKLEDAWRTAVHDTTTSGNLDMKTTMQMLRQDITLKRSML